MIKLLLCLLVPALLLAQPQQSEHFRITKSVIDAGGGISTSGNFALTSAFGQPTPIGTQSSEHFRLYAGYLSPVLSVSPLSPIQRLVIKEAQPDAILTWEAIAGAGSYSVYRNHEINFTPGTNNLVGTTTSTTYIDSGVLAGSFAQQYYIVIVNNP